MFVLGQESRDSTILISMNRDQIQATISSYQHNVLRHSFLDKLKEESVSFGGDSFIPRVEALWWWAATQLNCLLSGGGTLSGLLAKASKTVIGGSALQNGHEGRRCLCCCDWYQSIKQEVWITCLQLGVSSSQAITQIVQARSLVPERNKVRLRSFHTSLIDNYENGKIFEYDMNLPWGALTPIILQKKNLYISISKESAKGVITSTKCD